jgi:6-pyruvoyltetrahydropterin/6-carboxytetrahydropterin synthase
LFSISVEAAFLAHHHLRLHDGTYENPHKHDWVVRAHFARADLDAVGMVLDFTAVQEALDAIVARLDGTDLNRHEDFEEINPTAEEVARYIAERLAGRGYTSVTRVEVTEEPGCVAAFHPELAT